MKKYIVFMILAYATALSSCEDSKTSVPPETMTVSPSSATVKIKEVIGIHAVAYPKEANQQFVWASSNPAVATVSEEIIAGMSVGRVTGISEGNAVITVASAENASLKSETAITVYKVPTESIRVFDDVQVAPGEQKVVEIQVLPDGATDDELVWTSANPEVATVKDGVVTGIAIGGTTVTVALLADPSMNRTIKVDVGISFPFKGPHLISFAAPYVLSALNFDTGGEGVGYHDNSAGNSGPYNYRSANGDSNSPDVDIENNAYGGNVGWSAAGEWLAYSVDVIDEGDYSITAKVARSSGDCAFRITVDDVIHTNNMVAPSANDWQNWIDVKATPSIRLTAGRHRVVFHFNNDSNFLSMTFEKAN
ncbi:MAG: Ig-like domain-containing protein [Prevotellaceae bacterium]|jgi:hypothetical protein|nr:Ig-like domain-containing protein [Prevotellaceae bacterium]